MSYIDYNDIEPKMTGLWEDFLKSVMGFDQKTFNKKHQACPHCGGKDRFRWDDKLSTPGDGGYVCGQCGSGNGMNLFMKCTGYQFPDAVKIVADFINHVPVETREIKRKKAVKAVDTSKPWYVDIHEQVRALCKTASPLESAKICTRYGIWLDLQSVMYGEIDFIINTIRTADGRIVNAALIDPDSGETEILAKEGMSLGAWTAIGKDEGNNIYIVEDWLDAHIVHQATKAQVWCCYTSLGVDMVLREQKENQRLRLAVNRNDEDLIQIAANNLRSVIFPTGETIKQSLKMEPAVYDPWAIINEG